MKTLGLIAAALMIATPVAAQEAAAGEPRRPTNEEAAQSMIACAPADLDAAVACLDRFWPDPSRAGFVATSFDDTVEYHMTLGQWIRNNWGLWDESPLHASMARLGFTHPDDMSTVILNSYWLDKHDCPRRIDEQVRYYREWWRQSQRMMRNARPNQNGIIEMTRPNVRKPHLDCTTSAGAA